MAEISSVRGVMLKILLRRSTDRRMVPVSYTHLDVYKRQRVG